jgi:hypothetical protein
VRSRIDKTPAAARKLSRHAPPDRLDQERGHGGCDGTTTMNATKHIDYKTIAPEAYQYLFQLSQHLHRARWARS